MTEPTEPARTPKPVSLTGHEIDPAQIEMILGHVRQLSETALRISDRLPVGAD